MRSSTPLWLSALVLFFAGCGAHPSPDAGVDAGPSADTACAAEASALCAKIDGCINDAGVSERYGDLPTCLSRLKASCLTSLAVPNTARTPELVLGCVAARATESCADFLDGLQPVACRPAAGTTPSGSPCLTSAQCMSAFCAVPRGAACGTCAPMPEVGADCAETRACGPTLNCVAQQSGAYLCKAFAAQGAACSKDDPCASGLGCVAPKVDGGVGPGTCQALGTAIGAVCDPASRTAPGCDLDRGLFCDAASKHCAPVTAVVAGAPCGLLDGGTERAVCTGASTCEDVSHLAGTCVPRAADGTTCDTAAGPACMSPSRCLTGTDGGTRGVCTPPATTCP